jgi:uncharacterized protein (TIGR02266 family)
MKLSDRSKLQALKEKAKKSSAVRRADIQGVFRDFMALERKRVQTALSVDELARWGKYKKMLNKKLQPADADGTFEHRRSSLRVPVSLNVSFETCGEIGESLMTNLSRGGLFVATPTPLAIGTKVKLRVNIDELRAPIDVSTEVVSNNVGRDLMQGEPGMGLRFIDLSPEQASLIDELYERTAKNAVDYAAASEATSSEAKA